MKQQVRKWKPVRVRTGEDMETGSRDLMSPIYSVHLPPIRYQTRKRLSRVSFALGHFFYIWCGWAFVAVMGDLDFEFQLGRVQEHVFLISRLDWNGTAAVSECSVVIRHFILHIAQYAT